MAKAKKARTSMTKSDIIDHLAKKTGQTKVLASQMLDEFVNLAYKEAKRDFTIPGLGKIVVSSRKRRKGRNPQTGEEITIPARKVLQFRFAKQAKDEVLPKPKK
jgi:DNA-binding protein HU-beta